MEPKAANCVEGEGEGVREPEAEEVRLLDDEGDDEGDDVAVAVGDAEEVMDAWTPVETVAVGLFVKFRWGTRSRCWRR